MWILFSLLPGCLSVTGFKSDFAGSSFKNKALKPVASRLPSNSAREQTNLDFLVKSPHPSSGDEENPDPRHMRGGIFNTIHERASEQASVHESLSTSIWKQRLITKEDFGHGHKIASVGYVLSSFTIIGTGLVFGFMEVPDFLNAYTTVFILCSFLQSYSSIPMALKYRKNDRAARNGFIGSAFSSMFLSYLGWWTSPFFPEFLVQTPLISTAALLSLCIGGFVFDTDTVLHASEVIYSRRVRNKIDSSSHDNAFLDTVAYVAPICMALPLYLLTLWRIIANNIANNPLLGAAGVDLPIREQFIQDCLDGRFAVAGVGQLALFFYASIASAACASYGTLFVTLRDKKLISKETERYLVGSVMLFGAGVSFYAVGWI